MNIKLPNILIIKILKFNRRTLHKNLKYCFTIFQEQINTVPPISVQLVLYLDM